MWREASKGEIRLYWVVTRRERTMATLEELKRSRVLLREEGRWRGGMGKGGKGYYSRSH